MAMFFFYKGGLWPGGYFASCGLGPLGLGSMSKSVLHEIFLDTRVKRLRKCFSLATGFRQCLVTLVVFMGEPMAVRSQYHEDCCLRQREGTKLPEASFIRSRFHEIFQSLSNLLQNNHVPGSVSHPFGNIVSVMVASVLFNVNLSGNTPPPPSTVKKKNIVSVIKMLEDFSKLFGWEVTGNDDAVVNVFMTTSGQISDRSAGGVGDALVENLVQNKTAILGAMRTVLQDLKLPVTCSDVRIKKFCLRSAHFVFCTVSGSAKLNAHKMDLLLIDEVAQLKECESLIPLQLSGLKQAVSYW